MALRKPDDDAVATSSLERANFPQDPTEFDSDPRVSFSKLDNKFILETDDGQEFGFDDTLKRWIPTVSVALLPNSSIFRHFLLWNVRLYNGLDSDLLAATLGEGGSPYVTLLDTRDYCCFNACIVDGMLMLCFAHLRALNRDNIGR